MAQVEILTENEARKRSTIAFQNSSFSDLAAFIEHGRNFLLNEKDASLFDQYCDMTWLVDGIDVRSCDY